MWSPIVTWSFFIFISYIRLVFFFIDFLVLSSGVFNFYFVASLRFSDAIIQLSKIDDMMKDEAKNLREVIDVLHSKHKEYSDEIQTCISNHSTDQSEIKRVAGLWDRFSNQFVYILRILSNACS